MKVAGLFAGVGGLEEGFRRAGHHSELLCEVDPAAQAVLREHFPGVRLHDDIRTLKSIPAVDVLVAGFPCQDLSQAGRKVGIDGLQSGLIQYVFALLQSKRRPEWLLLENVSYMLRLDRGQAMDYLVRQLETLGYRWAYRVVDARAFGVPQRRQRVLLLASLHADPSTVLFADDAPDLVYDDSTTVVDDEAAYGFYWTEGLRGLGWTCNAIPTIKGGSSIGIPSPPAVWLPRSGSVGTPDIDDAERLQGFSADWTAVAAADNGFKKGARWKLVGNAVCVDMSAWVAGRLNAPGDVLADIRPLVPGAKWPIAAAGTKGHRSEVAVSVNPTSIDFDIQRFLTLPLRPLSHKAASGFLSRARRSLMRPPKQFIKDLEVWTAP